MGTAAATITHLLDTLAPLPLTARKMFGEYALYLDGKVVALVCDDQLFLKPTLGALTLLPDAERGAAYPGSKDYILGSDLLDDPDLCTKAMRVIWADSPAPKPKAPRKRKVS